MPPSFVKTVRDLIYWEYAKLIAGSAVGDRKNFAFVTHAYKRLKSGLLKPSEILRENKKLFEAEHACAYCGTKQELEWEHVIPKFKIPIDRMDNLVQACRACNLKKSGRDPFEWYGEKRQYEIPRVVLGKYLKLIYDLHEQQGTLDATDLNHDGKLNIYDLGVLKKKKLIR